MTDSTAKIRTRSLRRWQFVCAGIALFAFIYAVTVGETAGDTPVYSDDIIGYALNGGSNPAQIWEFGHLLLRPVAYLLWQFSRPISMLFLGDNALTQVNLVLFGLNFISFLALAPLTFLIARLLGARRVPSSVLASAVPLSSAVLNYAHSGTAYLPGLALLFFGFLCLLKGLAVERSRIRNSLLAGLFLGLACDVWLLYILALPSLLLAWLVLTPRWENAAAPLDVRSRVKMFALCLLACAAVGLAAYGAAIAICHLHSGAEFSSWMARSGHGMHADRPLVRFPTGVTRTLLYLGQGGTQMKQFVLGDAYARVRLISLFAAGLWKVAIVFLALAVLIGATLYRRQGWSSVALLSAAAVPTFGFAFLFDTGSPERYLPMYPALVVAVCFVLTHASLRFTRAVLTGFVAILMAVNLYAYLLKTRESLTGPERMLLVREHVKNGGLAAVMSLTDPVGNYFDERPLDPNNRYHALVNYKIFDFPSLGKMSWTEGLSCRVLRVWGTGGEVWLSKRVLAERPKTEWRWIEADHPLVRWPDTLRFFQGLKLDGDDGHPDGFVRLAHDEQNRRIFETNCPGDQP